MPVKQRRTHGKGPRPISLTPSGVTRFAGNTGEVMTGVCSVTAGYEPDLEPAVDVAIRYQVAEGRLDFTATSTKETVIRTDQDGRASIDALFTSRGAALVVAELVDDPSRAVFFDLQSEATTHQLFLYTPPTFPVDPGVVTVRIVALDHRDVPVTAAKLDFGGSIHLDTLVSGEVVELGNGEYEGRFETDTAGEWSLFAQDPSTRVATERCVHVLPGEPKNFRFIGELDPRASRPYGEVLLRVQLEDRYENPLDPHRIACTVKGRRIPAYAIVEEEARFLIRLPGHGSVQVVISDKQSPLSRKTTIPFAPAWLERPETVYVGDTFKTALYLLPRAEHPFQTATVEIEFDPELVSFVGLEKAPPGGPRLGTTATRKRNSVTIAVKARRSLTGRRYSNGIPATTVVWQCEDEGDACFRVAAAMSPVGARSEMCVSQKVREEKCICINIVYREGDSKAFNRGALQAGAVGAAISAVANRERCCPNLTADIRSCTISADDWKAVMRIGVVRTPKQLSRVMGIVNSCLKDRCINFVMVSLKRGTLGSTLVENDEPTNKVAIDPEQSHEGWSLAHPYTGAHEVGHVLGLNEKHETAKGDRDNLMYEKTISAGEIKDSKGEDKGRRLTAEQCEKISEGIGRYSC